VPEANLFGQDLKTNWDGSFELYIGGPERGPNWLPTTPGSRKLFLRQGFDSWDELPVQMRIERVDMTEPRPMPTPEDMLEAMEWAGGFVTGLMKDNPDWPYTYAEDVDPKAINQFPKKRRPLGDPVYNTELDKKRGRAPSCMCWKLAPDEALIIEFESNNIFWMITNMNVFFNSMDYLYRSVSYTPSRTSVDEDGVVRFILCHDDPGYHNWIDTQGFEQGVLVNRNLFSEQITDFHTRLVKRADLEDVIPDFSVKVTSEDRQQQMHDRFRAITRRYCL